MTIATATYRNDFNGETYELGFEVREGETAVEAAWGRCFRIMEMRTGWHFSDVSVRVS